VLADDLSKLLASREPRGLHRLERVACLSIEAVEVGAGNLEVATRCLPEAELRQRTHRVRLGLEPCRRLDDCGGVVDDVLAVAVRDFVWRRRALGAGRRLR
jgi:hypothetical protein